MMKPQIHQNIQHPHQQYQQFGNQNMQQYSNQYAQ